MNFDNIVETVKIVVGAAFSVVAIWGLVIPIDEGTALTLIELLAAILKPIIGQPGALAVIGLIFGGAIGIPALRRKIKGERLQKIKE